MKLTLLIVLQILCIKMPTYVFSNTPEGPLGSFTTVSPKPAPTNTTLAADMFW